MPASEAVKRAFENLNEYQKKAALHNKGPAMVIAGAGSGKSSTLTVRSALLAEEHDVNPYRIIMVTFTNAAAQSMRDKLKRLSPNKAGLSFVGTFHHLCMTFIGKYREELGFAEKLPEIYSQGQSETVAKNVLKNMGVVLRNQYEHRNYLGEINLARGNTWGPKEFLQNSQLEEHKKKETYKFFLAYQKAMAEHHAIDFEDIMFLAYNLFKSRPDILEREQKICEYLAIDEYQDTNQIQYEISKMLAAPQNNLFVIGDPQQSIYKFRGADYHNMTNLNHDYPNLTTYKLPQNYRSPQVVLDASFDVIKANADEHPVLQMITDRTDKHKIHLAEYDEDEDEAEGVAKRIERLIKKGAEKKEIAVLMRTNAQTRAVEMALYKRGIPYEIIKGKEFYERKVVKDLLAYLTLCVDPENIEAFERTQKIGKKRQQRFFDWYNGIITRNGGPQKGHEFLMEVAPESILRDIFDVTGYRKQFDENDPHDTPRLEDIDELLNATTKFDNLTDFFESVHLITDKEVDNKETDTVKIMTAHNAKGLEWDYVFIIGCNRSFFPSFLAVRDKNVPEERRLFYVAMTRAKQDLYLSYVSYYRGRPIGKSPFLKDIRKELTVND